MSDPNANAHFISALEKLNVHLDDYENHLNFRTLPYQSDAVSWNVIREEYHLKGLELAALQNARCSPQADVGGPGLFSWLYRWLFGQAATTWEYFVVTAVIEDCKNHSGWRKRVYTDATMHSALYDCRLPNPSIWYPTDSPDLHVSLMFRSDENASRFWNCLAMYNTSDTLLKKHVRLSPEIEHMTCDQRGRFVRVSDYQFADTESSASTHEDVRSATEVTNTWSPLHELRSLENIRKVPAGDTLYQCHIAPQAFYEQFKNDPDNIIFGEHLFHTYFDGDGKRRPSGASLDWGRPPRFKMEFESVGPELQYNGTRYFRINVVMYFPDPNMAKEMEWRWREGTFFENWGDGQKVHSFFYATNAEKCRQYIDIRQQETERRWGLIDDEDDI